jgi:hypothetical protein
MPLEFGQEPMPTALATTNLQNWPQAPTEVTPHCAQNAW